MKLFCSWRLSASFFFLGNGLRISKIYFHPPNWHVGLGTFGVLIALLTKGKLGWEDVLLTNSYILEEWNASIFGPWRGWQYSAVKYWQLFNNWHSIMYQKTWIEIVGLYVSFFFFYFIPFLDWIPKPVKYFLKLCHGGILDADTRQFFCPFLFWPCNGKLMPVSLKGWCSFVLMQPSNPLSQYKSY